ncbi:hypothetical protein AMATHDRAFT_11085 [Amanita thiersii Skay4041]|uniref:Uncharacterized protein n=1 Tax=Amanita thiersii Skay4041 TaxID=703135 RepID=A0A2A9NAC2_9AGAR|nr:hypothetical protein AMATHDRAFT_11085 [Amanita thiersii Skay4041]
MMVGSAGGGTDKDPDWSLNQALAQIQQLMNSLAALQNTVHQQNAIIQQLQNQVLPATPGSTPRGPKMATPPIYNGSMATCEGVPHFMDQGYLGTWIHANGHGTDVSGSFFGVYGHSGDKEHNFLH